MRVAVAGSPAWTATTPTQLFGGRYYAGSVVILGRTYDVSADGRRFLMIKQGGGDEAAPRNLVVVQNWFEELKRVVPGD
jgi:hypothetical protein